MVKSLIPMLSFIIAQLFINTAFPSPCLLDLIFNSIFHSVHFLLDKVFRLVYHGSNFILSWSSMLMCEGSKLLSGGAKLPLLSC
ncbi:hypothetical protein M501DRAFT_836863 [Patellaria atrata CBS 101060]|uniref:Secreted protein n=1 Tax=Patellaria atrata CBS 101060 TaxID=1346257 RepID=A0A9P4SA57_9PEZI|nr:hypothetical protein M501DRAFT_836863 [Patellaria atrata CBS 101060]